MTDITIEYVDKLTPIFTKPKRIKIVVGGRASSKSIGIADHVAVEMMRGRLWCCAREQLNSIEESVHRTILDEIGRFNLPGFQDTKTSITHSSGGRCFYRGLNRNITSLKSTLSGVDGLWIEEGEDLSKNTLRVLTASVRLNAEDTQKVIDGEDIKMPEIIITMNRGSRAGAVAKKWLSRAEPELQRCGYYEDDLLMVVEINYHDMPEEWFLASGLEQERQDDWEKLSRAEYYAKWHGQYLETVEGAIIKPEWFDACIDAHKIERLKKVFRPTGAKIAAHDPSGEGDDSKSYVLRHGSIIRRVCEMTTGEVDEGFDWAMGEAVTDSADWFVYDADGMGAGAKRQVSSNFYGTSVRYHMFRGSLSGNAQDNAEKIHQPDESYEHEKQKTYADTFLNNRSQYYEDLAERCYGTYRAVEKGEYVSPDKMISFDSEGIDNMQGLRSEMCRIPRKPNPRGLKQILSKEEMKRIGIKSPNQADGVMMSLYLPKVAEELQPLNYPQMSII